MTIFSRAWCQDQAAPDSGMTPKLGTVFLWSPKALATRGAVACTPLAMNHTGKTASKTDFDVH